MDILARIEINSLIHFRMFYVIYKNIPATRTSEYNNFIIKENLSQKLQNIFIPIKKDSVIFKTELIHVSCLDVGFSIERVYKTKTSPQRAFIGMKEDTTGKILGDFRGGEKYGMTLGLQCFTYIRNRYYGNW